MQVKLFWDNDDQTIIRWEFSGLIGITNYIVPINESAGMAMMANGKADNIINLGYKLPFPNRRIRALEQAIAAAHWYGLGIVVIVTRNPIARLILRFTLLKSSQLQGVLYTAQTVDEAYQIIEAVDK